MGLWLNFQRGLWVDVGGALPMPLSLAVRGQHSHPEDPFPDPYPSVSLKKNGETNWEDMVIVQKRNNGGLNLTSESKD